MLCLAGLRAGVSSKSDDGWPVSVLGSEMERKHSSTTSAIGEVVQKELTKVIVSILDWIVCIIHTTSYAHTVRTLYKDNPTFSKGPFCAYLFKTGIVFLFGYPSEKGRRLPMKRM